MDRDNSALMLASTVSSGRSSPPVWLTRSCSSSIASFVEIRRQLVDRCLWIARDQLYEDRACGRIVKALGIDSLGHGLDIPATVQQNSHQLALGARSECAVVGPAIGYRSRPRRRPRRVLRRRAGLDLRARSGRRAYSSSRFSISRVMPATSMVRAMYRSRMRRSAVTRIVGSSWSSASRLRRRSANHPPRSRIWIFRSKTSTDAPAARSKPSAPTLATNVSGSSPSGSVIDAHRHAGRQQHVAGAERRLQPGLIAVVEEEHVLRVFADDGGLLLGQRGAQRRDDLGDSGKHQPNRVEVAFDDDQSVRLANRLFRPVEPVQQVPLGEDLRLGRVEIFRLGRRRARGRRIRQRGR